MSELNTLDVMIDNIHSAISHLKKGECAERQDSFNLQDFWVSLNVAASSLSHEVTKLCMIISETSVPDIQQIIVILRKIENLYANMLKHFYYVPKEMGLVMRRKVQGALHKLLTYLEKIFCAMKSSELKSEKSHALWAGCVWESCEAIEHLPRNNLTAVCEDFNGDLTLIEDALEEIVQEMQSHDTVENDTQSNLDSHSCWSRQEFELIPACMAIVKTARACMRRIKKSIHAQGRCSTEQEISQLDDLMDAGARLSPAVDDFVSASYPPMDKRQLKHYAVEVVNILKTLLTIVKESHYIQEEDQQWLDFLLNAVDHNNNKLQSLLTV